MRLPRGSRGLVLGMIAAGLAFVGATSATHAQTGCRVGTCNLSTSPPVQCTNRATPYTTTVLLTGSGINFFYDPANPKIEPTDCIAWQATGSVDHSSSADDCADTGAVCTTPDASCKWDSGNIAGTDVPPAEICFYDDINFPIASANGFYCRIHSNPTHTQGLMFGTMRVTTPIVVTVTKSGTDIVMTWTGGGITGDVTYKVVRNLVGDPLFTVGANTVTGNPDAGTTGTTFTELGGLSDPASHYYLIRNRQINEL